MNDHRALSAKGGWGDEGQSRKGNEVERETRNGTTVEQDRKLMGRGEGGPSEADVGALGDVVMSFWEGI